MKEKTRYLEYNDPNILDFCQSLTYVVSFCDVRAKRLGITDPNCNIDHDVIRSYIKNLKVNADL